MAAAKISQLEEDKRKVEAMNEELTSTMAQLMNENGSLKEEKQAWLEAKKESEEEAKEEK